MIVSFKKMIPVPHLHFFRTERVIWNLRFYRYSDNICGVAMLLRSKR